MAFYRRSGPGLPRYRSFSITDKLHSVGLLCTSDRPVTETSTRQRTALTIDTHAAGGIRTHNPSKRKTAEPRLRLRGHWDRLKKCYKIETILFFERPVFFWRRSSFFLGPSRCWIISTSFKGREDETSPADFDLPWQLSRGDVQVFTLPAAMFLWGCLSVWCFDTCCVSPLFLRFFWKNGRLWLLAQRCIPTSSVILAHSANTSPPPPFNTPLSQYLY